MSRYLVIEKNPTLRAKINLKKNIKERIGLVYFNFRISHIQFRKGFEAEGFAKGTPIRFIIRENDPEPRFYIQILNEPATKEDFTLSGWKKRVGTCIYAPEIFYKFKLIPNGKKGFSCTAYKTIIDDIPVYEVNLKRYFEKGSESEK
jgi:hypothetical protein